jgi:hypothetical protein
MTAQAVSNLALNNSARQDFGIVEIFSLPLSFPKSTQTGQFNFCKRNIFQ